MLYISQTIAGISQLIFIVAAQTYAGNAKNENEREKNVFTFSLGFAIGSFIGPFIGGLISDIGGYPLSFLILGSVSFLSIIFMPFLKDFRQENGNQKEINLMETIRLLKIGNLRKAFLLSILILLGKDIYIVFFPLLSNEFGMSDTLIGTMVALNAGAGIVSVFVIVGGVIVVGAMGEDLGVKIM